MLKRYISLNLIFTVVGCLLFCACPNWFKCGNNASSDDSDNQTVEQAEKEIARADQEIAQAKTPEEKRKAENKKEIATIGKAIAQINKKIAEAKTPEENAKATAQQIAQKARKLLMKSRLPSDELWYKYDKSRAEAEKAQRLFLCPRDVLELIDKGIDQVKEPVCAALHIYRNANTLISTLEETTEAKQKAVGQKPGNNRLPADEARSLLNLAINTLETVKKQCKEIEEKNQIAEKQVIMFNSLIKKAKETHNNTLEKGGKAAKEAFERIEKLYADYKAVYEKQMEAYSHFKRVENTDLEDEAINVWLPLGKESDEAKKAFEKEKTALQALLKKP